MWKNSGITCNHQYCHRFTNRQQPTTNHQQPTTKNQNHNSQSSIYQYIAIMLKLLIYASGFSAIFLNRFGLPITNDFSLSFSYIFIYLALAYAFKEGLVKLDVGLLLCFAAAIFSGVISLLQGYPDKTLTSFLLLIFIYFPFTFISVPPTSSKATLSHLFYPMLVFLGIAGISQFFFQFLAKPDWLFDYRPFLPLYLQNKNIMNTVIPIGSFIKSNGFFLLEPSGFSQWMALGIFFFGAFAKPFFTFFVFLTGLITSFSGTGIILLLFIAPFSLLLFDSSRRSLVIFFLLLIVTGKQIGRAHV